jgi:ribosomal protein L11 methyltransferase
MALEWLADGAHGAATLLDYGCGSGILALAAARFGVARVDAVDIDPQARRAAEENALRNAAAVRVLAPEDLPPGQYDIVIANILAGPLIALAPLLAARTRRGGRLALAGLLEPQAQSLTEAYAGEFELAVGARAEGWVLLSGVRR